MNDRYLTLSNDSIGEFKDKGSKFLAYAFPVNEVKDFDLKMEELRKIHNKARHHCYAYKIGMTDDVYRINDDGEPSGTAGRPIFGQIESFGLTNVGIIVVRYFGGILLGSSGLIQAYKESTKLALQAASIIEKTITHKLLISFEYSKMGDVMSAIERLNQAIVETKFEEKAQVVVEMAASSIDAFVLDFKSLAGNLYKEEVTEKTVLNDINIEMI